MNNETVIIGGGPAGSAAAILLARQGVPVRLLERQADPHHKVCGEFISYEAAHYLKNLGVDLPALGAEPIHYARFYNGEQELTFELPFTAWSLSRCLLDSALLEQAGSAGAILHRGTAVRQLSRVGDEWVLRTRNSARDSATLSAKTVFLATGKHELRDWPRDVKSNNVKDGVEGGMRGNTGRDERVDKKETHNDFIGLKMHFRPGAWQEIQWQNTVEIHLFNGGYAGIEPIETGSINLCFLIKQDIYKACGGSWPAVFDWLGSTSTHMKQRLANLLPLWPEPLAVARVPYGYIASPDDSVPGLFRLGDQAAVIPSFAGDGIAIALHTAALAAQVHIAGGGSIMYQRRACQDLTPPVRYAKRLSDFLSHRSGRTAAFTFALLWPKSVREKLLGKMTLQTRVGLRNGMQ